MRILLLSAYDALSQRQWREGLVNYFSNYEWEVLALPPRYFNWRVRGNSLIWAYGERDILNREYDLILATALVDLSALRGLCPSLACTPALLYFHENQFAYPASGSKHQLEPQVVNLYSALSAQAVLFNSRYNRDSFFDGVAQFLKRMPDFVPPLLVEQLREKSQVLPVPLEIPLPMQEAEGLKYPVQCRQEGAQQVGPSGRVDIVWNHRWEYDKGPERLLACIQALPKNLPLLFHVVGQSFRQVPKAFAQIKAELLQRAWLGHWGFVGDETKYHALLAGSDLVLSTSLHDFQGVSVLEAVARGCYPVLPRRLAYEELFFHDESYVGGYDSYVEDINREGQAAARAVLTCIDNKAQRRAPDISALSWINMADAYRRHIESCAAKRVM